MIKGIRKKRSKEHRRKLSIARGGTGILKEELPIQLCECGCGEFVKPGNRFIDGHNSRVQSFEVRKKMGWAKGHIPWNKKRKSVSLFCKCGCGDFALEGRDYVRGHNRQGSNGWNKGLTKETHLGIAIASEKNKGRIPWNKKRKAIGQFCECGCGEWTTPKRRFIHGHHNRNKLMLEEIKKKIRIKATKRHIKQKHKPSYNEIACGFFEQFDRDFNTQGQYGNREFYIKALGYWVDYINFDLKLIIEWDEEHHYYSNGNLRKKDLERQKEIQEHFSDFTFVRLRQKEIVDPSTGFDLVTSQLCR